MGQKVQQKLCAQARAHERHEAFHSSLPHPLQLWDLLHLANYSISEDIFLFCSSVPPIIFRDVPFWQESSDLMILNIIHQHLQSKNTNIFHQKPILAEPHYIQAHNRFDVVPFDYTGSHCFSLLMELAAVTSQTSALSQQNQFTRNCPSLDG